MYSLPLVYFYETRLKNISWVIKYFVFPFLYICLLIYSFDWNIKYAFLNFIIFYNFYEIFYYFNDYSSYKTEINGIQRQVNYTINQNIFIFVKSVTTILLLWIVFYLFPKQIYYYILLLFLAGIVFFIHNKLKEKYRFITFILLYFLKYTFFWLPLIFSQNIFIYLWLIMWVAIFSSLDYIQRKNWIKIYKPFLLLDLYIFLSWFWVLYYSNTYFILIYAFIIIFIKLFLKKY